MRTKMNKYQEAKEILEKYDYSTKLELSEGIRNNITSGITVEQFFMMKKTCIELLDKATPMKPISRILKLFRGQCLACPNCKSSLRMEAYHINPKYCWNCGQHLDWREEC